MTTITKPDDVYLDVSIYQRDSSEEVYSVLLPVLATVAQPSRTSAADTSGVESCLPLPSQPKLVLTYYPGE